MSGLRPIDLDQGNSMQDSIRQVLIKNFTSLGLVQVTNYLLPLLVVPFLIRKIGIELFGLISFGQAMVAYYNVVVDYGFNLTITQKIALQKNNPTTLSSLASVTLVSKTLLAMVMLVVHILLCLLVPSLRTESLFLLGSFSLVIGQLLFPVWFFQGIEKMQFITLLNLGSKIVVLLLIFTFIRDPGDYILVLPIFAIANIVPGMIGIWVMMRMIKLKLLLPKREEIIMQWKEGFPVFLSNLSVTSYNSAPYLILSFFTTQTVIGYYGVAEKVMQVVRQFCGVYSQAIYPQVCKLATESHSKLRKMWRGLFFPFLLPYTLGCSAIFLASDYITLILTGHPQQEISLLIKILICVPPIVFTNIPSFQTLMAYQFRKEILFVLLSSSVLNFLLIIFMSWQFQAVGAAVSLMITELIISIGLLVQLERAGKAYSLLN